MPYIFGTVLVAALSIILTAAVRQFALRFDIVDHPGEERKIHTTVTPLLGGVAVILSFSIGLLLFWNPLTQGYLLPKHLIGVLVASLVLLIGGALDDKYNLKPQLQILAPIVAALIMVVAGIGIDYITNPLGGVLRLNAIQFELFRIGDVPYNISLIADVFTVLWIMGMMYTTKFLDGLDGLVSGITVIGALILAGLSVSAVVNQPETAFVACLGAAAFTGFLVFNWNPASIFLGESGSLFAGFLLGTVAIISGGKVATALLILGIPVLDVVWVILRRLFIEKRSPFEADRKHLHLRLVDSGLSIRRSVLVLYTFSLLFGLSSLFLHSFSKLIALGVLLLVMLVLIRHITKNHG